MTYHLPPNHPAFFDAYLLNTQNWATGSNGVRLKKIEGWDDHADIRDSRKPRNGQDGEYADTPKLGGRSLTLHGEISGATWADLQTNKRALLAALQLTDDERVFKVPLPTAAAPSFTHSTAMTDFERVNARVVDGVEFTETDSPLLETWTCSMRASDGRVFNDVATSTDSGTSGTAARTVAVDQAGTRPTPATITLTGPVTSPFSIVEPGVGLELDFANLSVAAGDTLTIDTKARTVVLGAPYERTRTPVSGLVALWMLDETSGTVADNYQGTAAYDGTYTGGFTLNQTGFTTGIASVALNGSTGYVSTPFNAALATTAFTFEAWVKHNGTGTGVIASSVNSSGFKGFDISVNASGLLMAQLMMVGPTLAMDASAVEMTPAYTLRPNQWHHVVITNAGVKTRPKIYVDGVCITGNDITTIASFDPATAQGILLGRRAWTTPAYFPGNLAAAAYYNRALSAAEVAGLYAARTDPTTSNAYGYLNGSTSRWRQLETGPATFSLYSTGLVTGSKMNVTYRDARA